MKATFYLEPDDSENIDIPGSFLRRFRSNSVAISDWYRGQLISPSRSGGNRWMVTFETDIVEC